MNRIPDIIGHNLKILFIGYNPGLKSAETGHHYASPSNRFWKLLFESGITPYRFKPEEDVKLLDLGYGSTNIVSRPTRGAAELKSEEFREGAVVLKELLAKYKPVIACYVGMGVYKRFSGRQRVGYGLQKDSIVEGVRDYVCPSPSGLNRMPYSTQLEYFRDMKSVSE
ncbi:MAG: mismatch-specific DNA-glycosylase [Clostridia bacterium]|nr:mismatch-specific DNA-glycosylase [Clostridia bacterium]